MNLKQRTFFVLFLLAGAGLFGQMDLMDDDFRLYFSAAPYKNLHLFSTDEQISGLLGTPEKVYFRDNPEFPEFDMKVMEYDGIRVLYYADLDQLAGYEIFSSKFQSYRGIRIGDPVSKVQSEYPHQLFDEEGALVLNYFAEDFSGATFFWSLFDGVIYWNLTFTFVFENGKVSSIALVFQNH